MQVIKIIIAIFLLLLCSYEDKLLALEQKSPFLSPGHMGPKAFPIPKIGNAVVGQKYIISTSLESHMEAEHEFSINPQIDFFLPWGKNVALKVFVEPFEYFKTSDFLRTKRHAKNTKGLAKGDIYFGALFTLLQNLDQQFYLVLNFQTKTTSGKKLEDARHFNAPGYTFDLTFQKDVASSFLGANYRISGYLAFLAWQSQFNQQNDAFGLAFKAESLWQKFRFGIEYGAYWGWQKNKDQPMVVRFQSLWPLKNLDLFVHYSYGLQDMITHSLALGSKLYF